jgi:hypothetical protein
VPTRLGGRHDGAVRPWKRLSDDERSVLLSELLFRHPELVAEAEEITPTLLVVEDGQELVDEIAARLRALRASGPVSVDTRYGAQGCTAWRARQRSGERDAGVRGPACGCCSHVGGDIS